MLCIKAPSRIHMTLVDLGPTGYRRNGGIGFSVDKPCSNFYFEKHSCIDVSVLGESGFNAPEINSLTDAVRNALRTANAESGLKLKQVDIAAKRHIGLGIGTTIALACVEAACLLNDIDIFTNDLIRMSGRGGTSGVGVHGYFAGGFIFDVGRKFDTGPLLPSDDILKPVAIPLAIAKIHMPMWPVGLFFPPDANPVSRAAEKHLFSSVLPLRQSDVFETAYHAIFGVVAAVADSDFESFCKAIEGIQNCPWKQHEIQLHETKLVNYINSLKDLGCDAVGMSSVGPMLYFFANDFSNTIERIQEKFPHAEIVAGIPSNTGRTIAHV